MNTKIDEKMTNQYDGVLHKTRTNDYYNVCFFDKRHGSIIYNDLKV